MKILFVSETYLDLYVPILEELKNQGHDVVFIPGDALPSDCYSFETNRINRALKKMYNRLFNVYEKYWINKIEELNIFKEKFDYYIDIQGTTSCPFLVNFLRKNNPNIKTCLYIWDSSNVYDYFRNAFLFEKVYTFDYNDSLNFDCAEFLPIYWCPTEHENEIKYDLSIVGTEHDRRLEIIHKVALQAKVYDLNFDFRIYIKEPPYSRNPLAKFWRKISPKWRRIYKEYNENIKSEYAITNKIPVSKVEKLMAQTKCIVDTDNEKQTGVTPRLLWAIAIGKKVITTNKNIVKMPFYNSNQIRIIDRHNPVIDKDFITENYFHKASSYIEELRIDKWIKYLIW